MQMLLVLRRNEMALLRYLTQVLGLMRLARIQRMYGPGSDTLEAWLNSFWARIDA